MFGFYPFRFEHYSHLELQMTYWMPLALLALHWFSETLRLRYLIAATVLTVAQLYSAMYFGVFFSIYAAVVLWVMLRASGVPWRRLVTPALTSAALGLILIVPLARPYLAAQALKGNRDVVTPSGSTVQRPIDYLRAHIRSGTYARRHARRQACRARAVSGIPPDRVRHRPDSLPPLGAGVWHMRRACWSRWTYRSASTASSIATCTTGSCRSAACGCRRA